MAIDIPDQTQQVAIQLETLEKILEHEFSALKEQDMETFDKLQPRKAAIMEMLGEDGVIQSMTKLEHDPEQESGNEELIPSIRILINRCHELHRRNEILINRKLEAVKGALASLREGPATNDIEVYTKSGSLSKSKVGTPIKKT